MSQLGEAIQRFHRLLDTDPIRKSGWVEQLREQMTARRLVVNHRPVSPVLRPHLLSRRQYTNLVKTAETLAAAFGRMQTLALNNPQLLNRLELLPGEKMLASVDPGYSYPSALTVLNSLVNNGTVHFANPSTDLPTGIVYSEALADVFHESAPVKEFRKKYRLEKTGGTKPLVNAMLKAFKEYGGGTKTPSVGLLMLKGPFVTSETHELELLAELLRKHGMTAQTVAPEQLSYREGRLRADGIALDIVYRGVRANEFLLRFDLEHPLVRAYREGKVCLVNSFRAELGRKKSLLGLLTDDALTAGFPPAERKAIRETIPWTRVVAQYKTTYGEATVDLPDFIQKNRQKLVLRPNDDAAEQPTFSGAVVDDASWDRALRTALRGHYVVQEQVEAPPVPFPVDVFGDLQYRDLHVDVQPHTFLGKVHGCSARLAPAGGGFSTLTGVTPIFVLDTK
jgi:hypothetical protein